MRSKKVALSILILVIFFFSLSICTAFGQREIKISHDMTPTENDPTSGAMQTIKYYIEAGTDFKVTIYPNNILGGPTEVAEQLQDGDIQIGLFSIGGMSKYYNQVLIYNLGYIYPKNLVRVAQKVFESDFTKNVFNNIEKKVGIKPMILIQRGGPSYTTNSVRPIRDLKDFKGLTMRGMDEGQMLFFEALGAMAVHIPFADLYVALETGVADGQRNPLSIIYAQSYQEVQKYVTLPGMCVSDAFICVSPKWYDSLTEGEKKTLKQAMYFAGQTAKGLCHMSDLRLKEVLAKDLEFVYQTDEEYQSFRKAALAKEIPWATERWGKEYVDSFLKTVENITKELELE